MTSNHDLTAARALRFKPFTAYALIGTAGLAAASLLAGCGIGKGSGTSAATTLTPAARRISGVLHGGQQPIGGATVQLYAVGNTGLKSAATPLLTQTVVTSATGGFTLSGLWDCTSNTATYGTDPLLYIVGTGGNPGLAAGTSNPALVLVGAIGRCSSVTSSTYLSINEVTTVAAVYALGQFMGDSAHIGAAASGMGALVNSFALANELASLSSGTAPGSTLPANVSFSAARLNSLANSVATCVNSTGTDSLCANLYQATGGTPSDVTGALLQVLNHPAAHPANLFNLASAGAPFQPTLHAAPSDWTLPLQITGGGIAGPNSLAVDANGSVWVANQGGQGVTLLAPGGAIATAANADNGIYGASSVAVDLAGNLWVADPLYSKVVKLTVAGGAITAGLPITSGGISVPVQVAVDGGNHVWIANAGGDSLTVLDSTGSPVGTNPITLTALRSPASLAIDANGTSWLADQEANALFGFSQTQAPNTTTGFTDGSLFSPSAVAIGTSGQVFVAGAGSGGVSVFDQTGTPLLTDAIRGASLSVPTGIAVDGSGFAWTVNGVAAGSVSKLSTTQLTPVADAAGLGSLNTPAACAIDNSGNLWTANSGDDSVTLFVGAATPVTTPLALHAGPK